MKPRTKKEVEIMKLHEKLPPINERQKSWAFAHCFDKIGYVMEKMKYNETREKLHGKAY